MSVQAGYVTSLARHLEVFPNSNNVTAIIPAGGPQVIPFPDFAQGSSYAITKGNSHYHGLQVKVEKQFAAGLNFLGTYTWSQARSDSIDLLNNPRNGQGYRAPDVPGFGIEGDYGLADFDIRHVVHFSGAYELPFGKGKRFMSAAGGAANAIAGGWSVVWSTTLQGGQPFAIPCPTATTSGTICRAIVVGDPYAGPHDVNQFLNPAAFNQPCVLGAGGPIADNPTGCIPLDGLGALGGDPTQVAGPGFHRLDLSFLKDFQLSERFRLQFRSEFFNIFNHPNFNAPGFGGNGVVAIPGSVNYTNANFGKIGATRDAPYDPRQIQFALKLYF
jgi:hypothetical protein